MNINDIATPVSISLFFKYLLVTPDILNTINADNIAPKNAPTVIPKLPRNEKKPNTIDIVAPVLAPEDIPRIYGSDKEFLVNVCINTPTNDNILPDIILILILILVLVSIS